MDRKARYPFRWFGLLTPLGVILTMPPEEFGPETLDLATPATRLSFPPTAIGPLPQHEPTRAARRAPPGVALETSFPSQYAAALPILRNSDGVGPQVMVKK
jgi:hypothetical protein